MDKYLVRTPRNIEKDDSKVAEKITNLIQTTIRSLKGVVVIEDVQRLKAILRLPSQPTEVLLRALNEAREKIPPRHILQETKIGHTIKRLTKHDDEAVATLAAEIVKEWKQHFQEKLNRPLIEVRCDKKTEELRSTARRHLRKALDSNAEGSYIRKLSEICEREAFRQNKNLVSKNYRRTVRAMIFAVQHKKELRCSVISGDIKPGDLVRIHLAKDKKAESKKS
ncbi:hypothetical protein CAPTEDRAFT_4346 [Capitella teleta]|uniref:TFIIS N-terminal domain-containing protein n=1 Tax=Capitella teleta TaxID=283909 RepID=R7UMP4_CAPTE|nr:hypothetical protein CAPTEDRAFT_4346 [Capitella teleta]|eukprot:ELU07490.1 hypothetical protein CAPTEDRAFT_4346 [Capitella teleta]